MRTRSTVVNHPFPYLAKATVAMLVVLLAASGDARAQQQPVAEVPAKAATLIASVIVDEHLLAPEPDRWEGFRHSVADAATASCFDPHALAHQEFVVEGLLRLPFMVQAATDGTCR